MSTLFPPSDPNTLLWMRHSGGAGLPVQAEWAAGTVSCYHKWEGREQKARMEKNQSLGIRREQMSVTTTCKLVLFWGVVFVFASPVHSLSLHRLISLKFKWLYVTLWWSSVPLIISEQCILFILYSGSLSIVHSNNWVWQHKRIGAMRPGHWANAAYTCLLTRLRPRLMCLRLEQRWHPDLQWPPSVTTPQHICISVHHESI